MPKFQAEVTFSLSTTINFDGDVEYSMDTSEVEEFENNSSFGYYGSEVEEDGGSVTFTIEAEDEDEAYSKAEDVVSDGNEVEDSSGIMWILTNVSVSVEKIEEPMTLERATEILSALVNDGNLTDEQGEAIAFMLDHVKLLTQKIAAIEGQLRETQTALAEVKAMVAAQTPTTEHETA